MDPDIETQQFLAQVEAKARAEITQERFREAVEARKQLLRERMGRPWWQRLIPFTVTINWRT